MRSEGLFVCLSVTTHQASVLDKTLKFRHQRSADDTLERFDLWILLTMLASRDTSNFVSQEAYERARSKTSARVINHMLLRYIYTCRTELCGYLSSVFVCQSIFPLVSCLIHLRVQACLYVRLVLIVVVWFVLER